MQLCLGANEVGERGANEVPKFIPPTEPPPPPPAPAAPTEPAPPPPARTTRTTTSTMANSSSTTSSTGTNNTSTMTTPAQLSARTQRPAQPAPASLAAVPPPAPAPHAGICSVHVSLYAQDSETYSYIQQRKNVGTQVLVSTHVWNAYSCWIHSTQTNMYTQANCENANTRELEVEKEKKIAHDTNMIYELQKYMQNVTKILRTRRLIRLPPERRDLKRPW